MSEPSSVAIIAAAGSGKTEAVVGRALEASGRVLITTYTDANTSEIRERLVKRVGLIPSHIDVLPWYTFLLKHGVKPFQHPVFEINELSGVNITRLGRRRIPKSRTRQYYVDSSGSAYTDLLADFVLTLNDKSGGAVLERLQKIYDVIFVDEIQDIAGADFNVLEMLMKRDVRVVMVGDPRQGTISTAHTAKNKKFTKSRVVDWIELMSAAGLVRTETLDRSYRCTQVICDAADALFPDLPATMSLNECVTEHDGVFLVRERDLAAYLDNFSPQVLGWDKRAVKRALGRTTINLGASKGLAFTRVLILPTKPIAAYFASDGDLTDEARSKLYVGLTRARQSVALVVPSATEGQAVWEPS